MAKNLRPPGEGVRVHGVHVRHHHVHPRPVRVFREEAKQDDGVEPTDESAGDEAAEKVVEEEVSQDEPDSDPKKIPRLVDISPRTRSTKRRTCGRTRVVKPTTRRR